MTSFDAGTQATFDAVPALSYRLDKTLTEQYLVYDSLQNEFMIWLLPSWLCSLKNMYKLTCDETRCKFDATSDVTKKYLNMLKSAMC